MGSTSTPRLIHSVDWPNANLNARMCVADGLLYVAEHHNNKVGVFSLANPQQPIRIGEFATGAHPRHIEIMGRFAFVCCCGTACIEIHDISNPALTSATLVGVIATSSRPKMFQIVGNEIFVVCYAKSRVEKHLFSLPPVGSDGFSTMKLGEVRVSNQPLCIAHNGAGLVAVCGLKTAHVDIIGATNMNLISSEPVGGVGHTTCVWVNKTQLLVTEQTHARLYSCDCTTLSAVPTGYCSTSPNPEQIEIVGNRCYVPSFTAVGETAHLDCIDISDARHPVKVESVPLRVRGAGFTAYHADDNTGYIYVDGHYPPHNIDLVQVAKGAPNRPPTHGFEFLSAREAGVAKLDTGTQSFRYTTKTKRYVATASDFVIRMGLGAPLYLTDPASVPDGKVLVIENVSACDSSWVLNSFGGFQGKLRPLESIVLASQQYDGAYQWDRVAGYQDKTYANYTTVTTNYTATLNDDLIRVSAETGVTVALPDPAVIPGKTITIKNVHGHTSTTVFNAYAGYAGTLTAGKAVTLIATAFDGVAQWDAIASY